MIQVVSKVCRACGVEKSVGEFRKNSSKPDGIRSYCKMCEREMEHQQKAGSYVSRRRSNEIAIEGDVGYVPVKTPSGIKFAKIDAKFAEIVGKVRWWDGGVGYPQASVNSSKILLHRYIMQLAGHFIEGLDIDHISRETYDSCLENLRAVKRGTNNRNSVRVKGKYRGVYLRCDSKKWRAEIRIDNKRIHIGSTFDTAEIAARAYDYMVISLLPDDPYAYTNFPRADYEGLTSLDDVVPHFTQLYNESLAA